MGLLDNLFGGGDPNQSLYGDALTPAQLAALRQRGLLGFLGGMQKSGALDSTIPTLTGKMPGSFASGLAAGAGGMGEAMDSGALNAMRAQQLGLQGQQVRSDLALQNAALKAYGGLLGGAGGSAATQPAAAPGSLLPGGAVPNAAQSTSAMSPPQIKQAALDAGFEGDAADKMTGIVMAESSGNPAAIGDSDKGGSYGLTQINANAHGPIAQTALNNPPQAMKLAFDISKGGTDFSPWTTYRTGAYKQFLPQTGQSEAAAPQGGLLNQPPPAPPQTSLLPPPPAAAAPQGGMMPGGAAMPLGINPQAAMTIQAINALRGKASPGFINDVVGLQTAGPKAQAEALGKGAGELPYAGPIAGAKRTAENAADLTGKPMIFRPGSGVGTAASGPITAMPTMTEIVNPDGSTSKVPIDPLTGQRYTPPGGAGSPASPQAAATAATSGLKTKLDPATEKSLEHAGTDDAKLYNDYRAMFLSNQSAKQDLTNAMEALQYVRSGAGAELTNDVAKSLRALHIDVSNFVTLPQPAQLEIVQKASGRLLGGAVKAVVGGNRPALGEFDYLKNTVVNEGTEPEAQRSVAAALLSTMNWQDKMFTEMQGHRKTNNGSPVGFDVADFGTRNPMPQYFAEAHSSFAPLKGEVPLPQHPGVPAGGAPGSPAAPRRGAYNPKTGQIEWQ